MPEETRTYDNIGPYAAHHVVNLKLKAAGSDKEIAGPQMYQYAKNGVIKSNFHSRQKLANGKLEPVMLDGNDFKAWLDRFVADVVAGRQSGGRKDYAKLADQF